jgi:signal transduction histidine kinase
MRPGRRPIGGGGAESERRDEAGAGGTGGRAPALHLGGHGRRGARLRPGWAYHPGESRVPRPVRHGPPAGTRGAAVAERQRLLDTRDAVTGAPLSLERSCVTRALRGEALTKPGLDFRARALDGRELEVNASAAPLRDAAGRIVGAVLVLRDLSERNRLEREREEARALRELDRRKDEFLAVVSHELRTPLASLRGYLELLQRRLGGPPPPPPATADGGETLTRAVAQARPVLDAATASVGRIARLVDDLLDDALLREGRLTLRPGPVDLGTVVRAAVAEQRALAPDRTLRVDVPAGPVPVLADADRIGQVIANYLTNALKYSQEDRPVAVRLEVAAEAGEGVGAAGEAGGAGGVARVSVVDEGPGLSAAARAHLWERYHRVEGIAVRSGSGIGLGLGLPISKGIVEGHGGRVGVESAPGHGSTFWFTLPLAPAPPPGVLPDVAPDCGAR